MILAVLSYAASAGPIVDVLDLKWRRAYGLPEVWNNACYVAVQDDGEHSLAKMHKQAIYCLGQKKPLTSNDPPEGSMRIWWIELPHTELLWAFNNAYNTKLSLKEGDLVAGFHVRLNDHECVVFTSEYNGFGHEVKHCFDPWWSHSAIPQPRTSGSIIFGPSKLQKKRFGHGPSGPKILFPGMLVR